MRKVRVYIAGPIFTIGDIYEANYLEQLAVRVGSKDFDGESVELTTFLPHRDGGVLGRTCFDPAEIYEWDWREISTCDLVIANLNGSEVDAGTAVEVGMAHALGIPVVLYRDDARVREVMNLMLTQGNKIPVLAEEKDLESTISELIPIVWR